ncbi:MAG: STAS domain-containing protein [Actinomycetota bacterium]
MSDIRQVDTITKLQMETKHTDGDGAVLSVVGEIDLASAPQFKEALAQLVAEEISVTIDLGDVTFMDSSGLHVLLTFASSMNGNGPVRIVNPSRTVLRTMQIVGMTTVPQVEVQEADVQHG